jgi:hypothetical protein
MQFNKGDIVTLVGHSDKVFNIVQASQNNLMLVRASTNEIWSAHPDDVAEYHPKSNTK